MQSSEVHVHALNGGADALLFQNIVCDELYQSSYTVTFSDETQIYTLCVLQAKISNHLSTNTTGLEDEEFESCERNDIIY